MDGDRKGWVRPKEGFKKKKRREESSMRRDKKVIGKRKEKPSLEIHFLRKKKVLFLHVSKEQAHNPISEGKSL